MDEDVSLHQTYGTKERRACMARPTWDFKINLRHRSDGNLKWVAAALEPRAVDKVIEEPALSEAMVIGKSGNTSQIELANNSVAWSPCAIGSNLTIGKDGSIAHFPTSAEMLPLVMNVEYRGVFTSLMSAFWVKRYSSDQTLLCSTTVFHHQVTRSCGSQLWLEITVIGGGATVVPGCDIGENAVLGAGSVTKSLPNDVVWAGNPAKYLMSDRIVMPSDNRISNSGAIVWIGKAVVADFLRKCVDYANASIARKQARGQYELILVSQTIDSLSTLSMKFTPESDSWFGERISTRFVNRTRLDIMEFTHKERSAWLVLFRHDR